MSDFAKDHRRVEREYDEFKVQINGLPDSISHRSDTYHAQEEIKAVKLQRQNRDDETVETVKFLKATWMTDGTHWLGTWMNFGLEHSKGDHAGMIQVMLKPSSDEPLQSTADDTRLIDLIDVGIRLPLLVHVSYEKHLGYDHDKKSRVMQTSVWGSAILSNGPFILNLDYDRCVHNSQAMREDMCFMMDRGDDRTRYVQFP